MAQVEPHKHWWTADEMAGSSLPDLPGTKQGINLLAGKLDWRATTLARRRAGRGGGWEYHWTLLPLAAQRKLLADTATTTPDRPDRGNAWAEFEAVPQAARDKAKDRLKVIQITESLHQSGAQHSLAVATAARMEGVSARSIYNWIGMIEGVAVEDRLAYLIPRNRLAKRASTKASCTRAFMDFLKSLDLRLGEPSFAESYRTACKKARAEGWDVLTQRTAYRRLLAEVPRVTRVYARQGVAGLERCFPAQIRDRTTMAAMEGVNADCHKIDIFVTWPDGTIDRPQIIVFQDLYSGKFLSWRVDHNPNKVMVMAAFGEMIETWGIPRHCLFDNGREFANKWLTGGTATRFRFKVREDDPLGVLPDLGIQVHWATPAHGQAKPVERAFRDVASDVAKDPRFDGAYVGNRPDAKPENYGSRAVPAETFLRVLAEKIDEHNARQGRLSPTCQGRSFDDTFADSYATAPIRKPTPEQHRLWMMGQQTAKLRRDTGQLRLYGNWYHSDWMSEQPGTKIIARFDPEDLHSGVHIYALDGAYLGFAECRQKVGFFDVTAARETARRKSRIKTAQRKLVEAHRPIPTREIAAQLDAIAPATKITPECKVVAADFKVKRARLPMERPVYQRPDDAEVAALQDAMILRMPKAATPSETDAEKPQDRFRRAQDLLSRSEAGKEIGRAEARWVTEYIKTAEYLGMLEMFKAYGADALG